MPPAATAETALPKPLTADERETLTALLARDSALQAPAVRRGDPYMALINLSVPRRGDPGKQTDLVLAGETVYLTAEEAAAFNRHSRFDGRQIEVVRKISGPDGTHEPLPRVPPRAVSGRVVQPNIPPPGSDAPRPDPEGSSRVQYLDTDAARVPERAEPQMDPAEMADQLSTAPVADAVDLPPRRGRARGGQ